ncbi:tRNA (guanine-N(7)-)-methyltransferase (tRNA(m7G46)-methyltransferase) [Sporothrix bragantina]|uniref:tRNA (Guanine-N(7)-)-methyltransferase (tRNA(m7G46)-methyltransferase) n=1 Tax=Sporothrix bragantina TaxID=671064 RepID=A0ABP0C294_9PEZI
MALRARDALLAGVAGFVAWGYATHWFPAIRFAGHGIMAGALLSCAGLLAFVVSVQIPIYASFPDEASGTPAAASPSAAALTKAKVTATTLSSTRRAPTVAFVSPEHWARERAALRARLVYRPAPLYPPMPRVSAALDTLLAGILRENVRSWYSHISQPGPLQDQTFPNDVDATIRVALGNLRDRLLAVDDIVEVLTSRLVPLLTAHFHDFNEAERAVRGRKLNRSITESDELDLAIASRYRELREARAQAAGKANTSSGLHPAAQLSYSEANTRSVQQDYLRRLVGDRLLPQLLPAKFLASRPVAALVREIVACAVLYPLLQMLADPDTYNQLMENYGRTMLQDRSTVRRLRAALDQHASSSGAVLGGGGRSSSPSLEGGAASGGGATRNGAPPPAFPRLAPGDSERRFERFVRAVRKVNNLSDARRFRSEVASQLKRDSQQQIQDLHSGGGGGASNPEMTVYLRRLEMSKRLLDQKVQYLAAGGDSRHGTLNGGGNSGVAGSGPGGSGLDSSGGPGTPSGGPGGSRGGVGGVGPVAVVPTVSRLETASLADLLRDASGLSYFMEYMDRQRLMPLVQFWLVVDGFRNPLEEEDEDDDDSKGDDHDDAALPASAKQPWTDADRLDIAQIDQAYLARPELHISAASRQTVRIFLEAGAKATPEQYYRARRAVLRSQVAVLNEMKAKHFQSFKKSDLFYKCLAAEEAAQQRQVRASVTIERAASPLTSSVPTMSSTTSTGTTAGAANSKPLPPNPANRLLRGAHPASGGGAGTGSGPAKRAGSATDLRATATTATTTQSSLFGQDEPLFGRRSLDGGSSNSSNINNANASTALFGDDDDFFSSPKAGTARNGNLSNSTGNLAAPANDPMADSVQSLGGGDPNVPDTKVVQAVEQALTTIMEDKRPTTAEDLRASLFGDEDGGSSVGADGGGTDRGSIFSGIDVDGNGKPSSGSGPVRRGSTPNPSAGQTQGHVHPNPHAHALLLHGDNSGKPSLASLGLVSAASRIGVFEDDDLFGDDQAKYLSDDEGDGGSDLAGSGLLEGPGGSGGGGGGGGSKDKDASGTAGGDGGDSDEEGVHEAAPGDLGLVEAIAALSDDIDRLGAQDAVVDSLLKKAELTNNTAELRILRKSKASLQREIRRKELQRQQYALQETDNSLYGRATVRLTSVQSGREEDTGKEYAQYVIEVQRVSDISGVSATENGGPAIVTWTVVRRYSAFWALHQRLRGRYPSVRALDFPRRRVVLNKLQGDFLQKRRVALERYLRALLLLPDVCRSRELRAFLSQRVISNAAHAVGAGSSGFPSSAAAAAAAADAANLDADRRDVISRLYDSVADGMEDILGSIPVLDQLSTAGQNLIAAAASQLGGGAASSSQSASAQNAAAAAAAASAASAEAAAELAAATSAIPEESAPFVKPICDIFLEIFELNRSNNWLRGRAVVVVLHQLLGGTIERKLRENVRTLLQEEEALLRYLGLVQDALFPADGVKRPPRTPAQKARTRTEAGLMLATLVPDLAGSVVGRVNAQAASRRIFATFNNSRLNAHLAFTILDEAIDVLFTEA